MKVTYCTISVVLADMSAEALTKVWHVEPCERIGLVDV
jgi:hypothetical protein